MIKLKNYYKPFLVSIIIIVGLLFVQSQAELSLPDYMSEIVTNGIQSGGAEDAVAQVMSEETYDHICIFLDDQEIEVLEENYTLIENSEIDQDILDLYSTIDDQNIYVLNDTFDRDALNEVLLRPFMLLASLEEVDLTSEEYATMLAMLPEGSDVYTLFSYMSEEDLEAVFSDVDAMIETLGESTSLIAAGTAVLSEYESLGRDIDELQNDYIKSIGLTMLVVAFIGTVCAISVSLLAARIGAGVARNLRKAIFEKVESFSNEEFNKFSTASLITRTTNDITQVQMVTVMMLRIVFFAPMMGIGGIIHALNNAASMAWIIVLVIIVILCIIMVAFTVVLPKFKIIQTLIDKLNLTMRENLSGMLVIRAFGNEAYSEDRFEKANNELTKVNLFTNRSMSCLMPLITFIMNVVMVAIVWFGAKEIDAGTLDIGKMMAFMQYAMQIIMAFIMIAVIAIMIPRASVAAGRIYEVLTTEPKIHDPKQERSFDESKKGFVEFKNVSFQYPGAHEAVLENINFQALPGQTTAIIGSTGAGKSTLINLIPRFYEVTSGEVLVSGVDVREVTQHNLRDKIGLVPQIGNLFSGTIESNVKYGNESLNEQEVLEILRIAQASEFIESKEEGIQSSISQGGTNVSGGQKQRLAIARALAKNPDVLVFDDSFSALDFKTDARLRQELEILCQKTNQTVIIVGQRIASIMGADQIIVLDDGKMVGIGKHDELMKTCEVYQEIAHSQLSKEELTNG
ncbi:ABC transporter ATP-binding protein [Tannockella kyphosi]|uniref:ABC transporter ATP-binding protein n=1 Tax=Tannockella kyphosi TaxID=2899121 RepID=UPI0020131FAF|nr:ABC transporter ATP-binding protein [Tannockella kyphosi]